jgi:hypothetical protein
MEFGQHGLGGTRFSDGQPGTKSEETIPTVHHRPRDLERDTRGINDDGFMSGADS